jgi:RNA polymerase sigma-B factor
MLSSSTRPLPRTRSLSSPSRRRPGQDARPEDRSSTTDPRFATYKATGDREVRNALIEDHRWVGGHCVQRFLGKGVPKEDLEQVAMLGLVKAVDRFDPDFGYSFSTFAIPTIMGELRRYFRDRTWSMRVRRRSKENHLVVVSATDELQQILGRSPTVGELARHCDLSTDETLEALEVADVYRCAPLDVGDDERNGDTARFGVEEPGYALCEARTVLPRLLEALPCDRDRLIIKLRFVDEMTQSQIAAQLGISQVQVSRLLRSNLELMRERLAR